MFNIKKTDLISVVVPNYNNSKYLSACLNSIFEQTYKNFEILLIDDCSSDDSLKIIKGINDSRLKLIALDKNVGVSRARNTGIRSAKGQYLTTLDSDDLFINKRKLEKELAVIKKMQKERIDVVAFSNIVRITESGEKTTVVGTDNIKEGMLFEQMLLRSIFIPRDFLCKKEIYEEAGFYDEAIEMYEDWDLKLRIARNIAYSYTGIEGVGYRDRPNGLSKAANEQHIYWKGFVSDKNSKDKFLSRSVL